MDVEVVVKDVVDRKELKGATRKGENACYDATEQLFEKTENKEKRDLLKTHLEYECPNTLKYLPMLFAMVFKTI